MVILAPEQTTGNIYKGLLTVVCEQISLIFEPQITTKTAYQTDLYFKIFIAACQ